MGVDLFVGGPRVVLHAALLTALTLACDNQPFSGVSPVEPDPTTPAPEAVTGGTSPGTGETGSSTQGSVPVESDAGASQGGAVQGQGGSVSVTVVGESGAGGQGVTPVAVELELIDDVEGGFPAILPSNGRNGFWYTAQDDSGGWLSPLEAFALEPPRSDSHHAASVNGVGFTAWGALLGVSFLSPFAAYDASAYCAVRFLARGSGEGWALRFSDSPSEPTAGGCGDQCYNYLGHPFEPAADWQQYEVRFDELEPAYAGSAPRSLESSAIFAIRFTYENTSGDAFALFVDDLSFVPKAACQ